MNFFNRTKTRTPVESVRMLREYLPRLEGSGSVEGKKKVCVGKCECSRCFSVDEHTLYSQPVASLARPTSSCRTLAVHLVRAPVN